MSNSSQSEAQQLQRLKGHRLGPYLSHNPVSATQVWQWCSAMGDRNPSYRAGEQQIAPPAMMQMWTMRDFNDQYAPGSTSAAPYQVFEDMRALGYPANVAVSYDIRFLRYLRVGERAKHFTTVVNISERKSTRLGTGFFVTERVEYLTDDESEFAEALITYFQYQPTVETAAVETAAVETAAVETAAAATAPSATAPAATMLAKSSAAPDIAQASPVGECSQAEENPWQPDFSNLDPARLRVGDVLPTLRIPITHKLIVGGALATQDFVPVHHNLPAAQAAGMADIFMNILTTSGLSARYLSDWAGADSRLQALKFNLLAPNFPGDVMVMAGAVTAIEPGPTHATVQVAFSGSNGLGYHTTGDATLALPTMATT
jgi:acyl dehydratase